MNKEEAIQHVCETVGIAYRSIGNHDPACDCFCKDGMKVHGFDCHPETLEYVRQAVIEKLERDGIKVKLSSKGF